MAKSLSCVLCFATLLPLAQSLRTKQDPAISSVIFTVSGAGDERVHGEWQHSGWFNERPRYSNDNAIAEWSEKHQSWEMYWDNSWFGTDHHYMYVSKENKLSIPLEGWTLHKDGTEPAPNVTVPSSDMDHDTLYDGYFVFLNKFAIWDAEKMFNPVNPHALLEMKQKAAESEESPIAIYHSEIHLCRASDFSEEDRHDLLRYKSSFDTYKEVQQKWWEKYDNVWCGVLAFTGTGGDCSDPCCAVQKTVNSLANPNRGYFKNASKYLYGFTTKDKNAVYEEMCKCGDHWNGRAYNFLNHNCNTFSSSIAKCSLGLSSAQPLKWSSMGAIDCCNK